MSGVKLTHKAFGAKRLSSYLNMEFIKKCGIETTPARFMVTSKQKTIKQLSIAELLYLRLPMLLHYEDRDSMAHSIESRVPFLDYNLVHLLVSLPDSFKLHNGETKSVFRKAMDGVIPEKIKNRQDKMGFVTPEEVWIKSNPEFFRPLLKNACSKTPFLCEQKVMSMLDSIITRKKSFDFTLWQIISFSNWLKVFNV